jgi:hypothetical protein
MFRYQDSFFVNDHGKVMDVQGSIDSENRNMVIKTPNGNKGQLFYFDQKSKTIKTRINNQSWDIKSSGRTTTMQIWSTNSGWW